MSAFKVIGFTKKFNFETSYQKIPQFWDEVFDKYLHPIFSLGKCKHK